MSRHAYACPKSGGGRTFTPRRSSLLGDPRASISRGLGKKLHEAKKTPILTAPLPAVAGFEVFLSGWVWVFGDIVHCSQNCTIG
jgi:hypothetical protein